MQIGAIHASDNRMQPLVAFSDTHGPSLRALEQKSRDVSRERVQIGSSQMTQSLSWFAEKSRWRKRLYFNNFAKATCAK